MSDSPVWEVWGVPEWMGTLPWPPETVEELLRRHPDHRPRRDSIRTTNVLLGAGIRTVAQLLACEEDDLLSLNNFGNHSLGVVIEALADYGLRLKDAKRC